jgi:hypothetical protein
MVAVRFARWRKFDPRKSQSILLIQIAVTNSAKFTVKQLPASEKAIVRRKARLRMISHVIVSKFIFPCIARPR